MSNFNDFSAAQAAVTDPATSAADLAQIAQLQPGLRAAVAAHPAAYPGLLDWLDQLGDQEVRSAIAQRRAQDAAPVSADAQQAASAASDYSQQAAPAGPDYGQQAAPGYYGQQTAPSFFQQADPGATVAYATSVPAAVPYQTPGQVPGQGQPPRKRPGNPLLAAGIGVLVLALVAVGIWTRGFGLFPAGGASSPEAEARNVAEKAVAAVNSFSAANLLNNPLTAFSALSDEIAPSERRTPNLATAGTFNLSEMLGINSDSVNWIGQFVGSFKVETRDLQFETTQIGPNAAVVWFKGGTLNVTANVDQLSRALDSLPDVSKRQATESLAKYGLSSSLDRAFADLYKGNWKENFLNQVRNNFPYQLDFADAWADMQSCRQSSSYRYCYSNVLKVIVVNEGGRWYLSSLLTGQASSSYTDYFDEYEVDMIVDLMNVTPAKNANAVEAARNLVSALGTGDPYSIAAQLPLPERRYLAFYPYAVDSYYVPNLSGGSFTEVANRDGFAKLRIDNLVIGTGSSAQTIYNGTCLETRYDDVCLNELPDYLNSAMTSSSRTTFGVDRYTGIDLDLAYSKAMAALTAMVNAINPNEVGVVAVQENGSWYVSVTATAADLSQQLAFVLSAGLKSVAVR